MHDSVNRERLTKLSSAFDRYDSFILFDSGLSVGRVRARSALSSFALLLSVVPELMHFSFTYIMRRISFYLIEQYLETIKSIEMLGSVSYTWIHLVMADLLCAPYVASWRSVEVLAVRGIVYVPDLVSQFFFRFSCILLCIESFRNDDCCYRLTESHLSDLNVVPATHQW